MLQCIRMPCLPPFAECYQFEGRIALTQQTLTGLKPVIVVTQPRTSPAAVYYDATSKREKWC